MKSESNVVVFDSCVLSAYLGLNPKESQEHIAAKTLVNDLVKKKYEIFIPVQAIQEVLICIDDLQKRNEVYQGIAKYFKIVGLYLNATQHLISLINLEKRNRLCSSGTPRDHIRTDEQIIAIALSINASTIYSSDSDFPKIAEDKITIINYREFPTQQSFKFET